MWQWGWNYPLESHFSRSRQLVRKQFDPVSPSYESRPHPWLTVARPSLVTGPLLVPQQLWGLPALAGSATPGRWAFTGLLFYPLKETLREYLSRPSVFWRQILVSSTLAARRQQNYPLRPQTTSDRASFLASLHNGSVDPKVFPALPGKERGGWRPPPSASRSLLQFLPSLSTWHTTGTFDKGCLVLELSCGRSVTQIDKPPTGCSFLLWRKHDPRRKEWIIVKRLFLYLIQNLRLFVSSFKKKKKWQAGIRIKVPPGLEADALEIATVERDASLFLYRPRPTLRPLVAELKFCRLSISSQYVL